MRKITYREVLKEALREEMRRDPRVFLLGEDIAQFGGSYKVTQGLLDEFGPERVRNTPISEAAIVGAAVGAALTGMRPVAELMYVDFSWIAMDQIANQAAKNRYMFGGKAKVPMVLRTQGGTGRSSAAQHAQSLEAWFIHIPGLKVVMPATPYDAKGLLKTAIRDDNPVIFIEHKLLYPETGEVPEEEVLVPLGVAEVKRAGEDVTVVAHSRMVHLALRAADRLAAEGISCEVVDPRTLDPLDVPAILRSVEKTSRLHPPGGGGAVLLRLGGGRPRGGGGPGLPGCPHPAGDRPGHPHALLPQAGALCGPERRAGHRRRPRGLRLAPKCTGRRVSPEWPGRATLP